MKVKLKISRRNLADKENRGNAQIEITGEAQPHPVQPKLMAEAIYKILSFKEGIQNAKYRCI
jgi:hypothetical protein